MAYRHIQRLSPTEVQALPAVINTCEACGILGTQPNTIQRWFRQGKVPASKVGGRLLFSKATVCALAGIDTEGAAC